MSAFRINRRAPASTLRSFANAYAYDLLADHDIPADKPAFARFFDNYIRRFRPSNSIQFCRLAELAAAGFALRRYRALHPYPKFPNEPSPIPGHPPAGAPTPNAKLPNLIPFPDTAPIAPLSPQTLRYPNHLEHSV